MSTKKTKLFLDALSFHHLNILIIIKIWSLFFGIDIT
jgi:hypothetical protein